MILVAVYSFLLVAGMILSQLADLSPWEPQISLLTTTCLAYIMIEVGLEFTLGQGRRREYTWDFFVAMTAAVLPTAFCAAYFVFVLATPWKEAVLVGMSAAPTSAGVLFTMLTAAGLGTTWLFRKARVLAVFDDLGTILLLVPIKILVAGFMIQHIGGIVIMAGLLVLALRYPHQWRLPVRKICLLGYAAAMVVLTTVIEKTTHIHLEILWPAFVLGGLIFHPPADFGSAGEKHEPKIDFVLKGAFMFLVGCSLPKVDVGGMGLWATVGHVAVLLILSNVGKCFPVFGYPREAGLRERVALSVAMFPRGEVGAGVLLIALGYQAGGIAIGLAVLTLALNLLLTGVFIGGVIKLLAGRQGRASGPG